jgi:hypothetical protein
MPICLVANIPDKLIIGSVKNMVKRYGQFDDSQAGTKMTAVQAHYIYDIMPQFIRQQLQLVPAERFEIGR